MMNAASDPAAPEDKSQYFCNIVAIGKLRRVTCKMKWLKAPPFYVWASLAASSVSILFGLDTGNIGPVTTMPAFRKTFGDFSPTVHGVVVSSVLISGAFTALIAGILGHRFGQVRIFAIGSFIYGVGAAIQSSATSLGAFIVGRLIQGIGEGLFVSNVWVQVSEMSPTRVRGTLTALPQFTIVLGLVCGFFICYGTSRLGASTTLSWRLPLVVSSALGFLLSGTYWFVPASPRWLLARGRFTEARDVLIRLGFDEVEREKLLEESMTQVQAHNPHDVAIWEEFKQTFAGFREAFSVPFRARTIFGCFIMGMQQLAGIDGVFYYAPILFEKAGLSGEQASFLASGVSALAILGITIPATFLADKWGRRTSSLLGGVLITTLMLLMGSLYAADKVHADRGAGKWVVIVSIYLFAIVFNGTWAIGFRIFLIESLPRKTRSSASSLAQSANWFSNYVVALITPVLISKTTYGAYYLFAFSSLFTTVIVALRMFETRGHSLEEIEQRYTQSRSTSTGVSIPMLRIRRVQATQ